MTRVSVAFAANTLLGECPVWSPESHTLYWLDCPQQKLTRWRLDADTTDTWDLPVWTGSIALCRSGGLVCATETGFWHFSDSTGAMTCLAPRARVMDIRLNDGKCDAKGRFWAGEFDASRSGPNGRLYSLDGTLRMKVHPGNFTIFNGICWSPDNTILYAADSVLQRIYAYDFDLEAGSVANMRPIADIPRDGGLPDGATVDSEGFIWIAVIDGGRLTRLTPDGTVDRHVELPVQRPTSCVFGGPELDILFVTTARSKLTESELRAQPLAGSLLAVETGSRGLAPAVFAY